jgi:hypothetical protein
VAAEARALMDLQRRGSLLIAHHKALVLTVGRIRRVRGALVGELSVIDGAPPDGRPEQIAHGTINLSSLSDRGSVTRHLERVGGRDGVRWPEVMEEFCIAVLRAERESGGIKLVGRLPVTERPPSPLAPILMAGFPNVIFAAGGTGKSTLCGGIAVSVQTGKEIILDWKPSQGNVYVLDWEANDTTWDDLIQQIARGAEIDQRPEIAYQFMTQPLSDVVDEVAEDVQANHISLLIIDSVGMAAGGSQDGSDANDSTLRLHAALRQIGVTSLCIDHLAGADLDRETASAKAYGSVYKTNLAKSVWELRREKEPVGNKHELLLIDNKRNYRGKLPPMELAITYGWVGDGSRIMPPSIKFESGWVEAYELTKLLPLREQMKRLLLRETGQEMADKDIATKLEIKDNAVRSTLSRNPDMFIRPGDGLIRLKS